MSRAKRRGTLVAISLLVVTSIAQAAEPKTFTVLTAETDKPPTVELNDVVQIRIDGDTTLDTTKIKLRIDGSLLGVEPRLQPDRRELSFVLARTDGNRALWSRLLGAPFGHQQMITVPIGVEVSDKLLNFQRDANPGNQAQEPKIMLVTYDDRRMVLGILLAVLVAVITALMCRSTTMMRDTLIPQVRLTDRPYSLGRFQMAAWFCIIFASFAFILAVTDDLNSITAESFILLGISGATALGAVAVDQTKNPPIAQVEATLASMGLKTLSDIEKLYDEVFKNNNGGNPAGVPIQGIANPTLEDLWDAYQAQIVNFKTAGFLKDLVTDVNGPTIHRWQILIWTLILGGVYLWRVYSKLETPTLGTNLLTLMGISGGVYLGFKIPERQN